jgi:hypothetical protein
MLTLLFAATLALPLPAQDEGPKPPDPKVVRETVDKLKAALKQRDPAVRMTTINDATRVLDAEVVKYIGKGLNDSELTVRMAAVEALRYMKHPDAVKTLESKIKRDRKVHKDAEYYSILLKAMSQHGNPSSISILKDKAFANTEDSIVIARIYGLGHIRSKESIEAIIDLMTSAGRKKANPFMSHFRISLMMLTGVDKGKTREPWFQWWNDNKKTFELPKEPPLMPKQLQNRWDRYWGYDYKRERPKKRGDRGNDPERS